MWARLPFQFLFIALVLWIGRVTPGDPPAAKVES
jgi:hypothetical protein